MKLQCTHGSWAERRVAPKPAYASCATRLAVCPFMPAQASLEPRLSVPSGDRSMYASNEGLS